MRAALSRLYALGPGRMRTGRERLRRLLQRAGDPQLAVPSVLVGGTNGKGMVVAALSAMLSRSCATGAFLKPHLKSITERWRIDDRDVEPEAFAEAARNVIATATRVNSVLIRFFAVMVFSCYSKIRLCLLTTTKEKVLPRQRLVNITSFDIDAQIPIHLLTKDSSRG